jgi:hypothetical protein
MDACSWCQRHSATPLGPSRICDVCAGLCASALEPRADVATRLYRQSFDWVMQALRYREANRAEIEPLTCWWCGRLGQPLNRHRQAGMHVDPTLCFICDSLLQPPPLSEHSLLAIEHAYEQICLAIASSTSTPS